MPRPSRRAEVRATAARLIREYGYGSATMDLIADAVGLNKGTLYHYYPSKSDILFDLLSEQVDATLAIMDSVPGAGTATDRMRTLVSLQVDRASAKQDEVVLFFQELPWIEQHLPEEQAAKLRQRIAQYQKFTKQLLNEGIRTGEFRDLSASTVMFSIIGVLAYIPSWFRPSSRKSREQLVQELTEFVMNGIVVRSVERAPARRV